MAVNPSEAVLSDILHRAQVEGALGARPIADVLAHARGFVAALETDVASVLDLGSGAGVPGLVIALDRPLMRVTLVDRRTTRVDALRRAVTVLGWTDRVHAVEVDAEQLSNDPSQQGRYDAVVARGFAEPMSTLRIAARLARVGGWVVISEPPPDQASRWETEWVRSLGLSAPERCGPVVRFHVEQAGT